MFIKNIINTLHDLSFSQNSLHNKHLKTQDLEIVNVASQKFSSYLYNSTNKRNTLDAKEEQFQVYYLLKWWVAS